MSEPNKLRLAYLFLWTQVYDPSSLWSYAANFCNNSGVLFHLYFRSFVYFGYCVPVSPGHETAGWGGMRQHGGFFSLLDLFIVTDCEVRGLEFTFLEPNFWRIITVMDHGSFIRPFFRILRLRKPSAAIIGLFYVIALKSIHGPLFAAAEKRLLLNLLVSHSRIRFGFWF